ncbi:MAG: SRPBCC family protein [Gordonia sp. (in: high G+C Gram-positive bacteria)]|uniref:SRPBCC family protein n=1 Tax=Gordonia sp. (in: high G+C Gram-positive bacteria) TaxID=84139 RepID=UPI0039E6C5F7
MGEVRHSAVVKAPRDRVFAYVNDYRNVPDYMFGVSTFRPQTDQTEGVGAVFDTAIKIGPKELTSSTKCVEWVKDEKIRLESVKGLSSATEWRFSDGDEPGTTKLDAEFDYSLPGGLAGKILGGLMGPFIDQAVKHTDSVVRKNTEN